jgi:integrase
METLLMSAGGGLAAKSSADNSATAPATPGGAPALVPSRDGSITIQYLIDAYLSSYAGQDRSRLQRLSFWLVKLGHLRVVDLTDDHIFYALESLAEQCGRYWAGKDADGKVIFKAKRGVLAPATINRYAAALAAVLTWSIKKRLAPRNWENPCKRIERRVEDNEVVRFLSDAERTALFASCRESAWPKLYLKVLLAVTTGARRGELERMRWRDIDFDRALCAVSITKNGDPKVLPLVPTALAELRAHLGAPGALVFASSRRPDVAYNDVMVWQRALKKAGVRNFRFHDLRHSCASYLAQSGATLLEIADVLGHRQLSVTKRYSHLTTKNKSDLVNRVLGGLG